MSKAFDEKFENWLNEQLLSIKSLSVFRRNRQHQQPSAQIEHSRLHPFAFDAASYHSVSRSDGQSVTPHQATTKSVEMSRTGHDAIHKHGGNYYQFAYNDDDDVQSFEDIEEEDEDEERRRHQRLSRILGDQCIDFGSETALEMDDEMALTAAAPPSDENQNLFDVGKTLELRASKYSTTSLEFSDGDSFNSATGSDSAEQPRDSGDWTLVVDQINNDDSTGDGLTGFVEFSRVRDGNEMTDGRRVSIDGDSDDDPLKYGVLRSLNVTTPPNKLLSPGLLSVISGRGRSSGTRDDSGKSPATKSTGARRMDEMVAIKYHKTETSTSGGMTPGGDFMDDDEILAYPNRHHFAVNTSNDVNGAPVGSTSHVRGVEYASATQGAQRQASKIPNQLHKRLSILLCVY